MLRFHAAVLSCALLATFASAATSAAGLEAHRIEDAATAARAGGPDGLAGFGDWFLSNATLCAVVSDPSHESVLSAGGGVLIDLGHCDETDDEFNVFQPLFNFSRDQIGDVATIAAGSDEHEAWIETAGERNGVRFETRYVLDLEQPERLRILTRLERQREGDRVFVFGDTVLHGGRQLAPFAASTRDRSRSRGFHHPEIDVDNPVAMVRAIQPHDLHVLHGRDGAQPGISYGLWLRRAERVERDGTREALPFVALNGADFTLLGVFTQPLWFGDPEAPGLVAFAQTLFMDIDPGEVLEYERWLMVGRRADAASVTDRVWPDAPKLTGRIDDPRANLFVDDGQGNPVTTIQPEPDGRFQARLPAGTYRLRASAPGSRTLSREFAMGDEATDLGALALPPVTRVALPQGTPMRLVFKGLDATPDPRFGDDGRDFRQGPHEIAPSRLSNSVSLAGTHTDPTHIDIAPGRYRVLATRGLEFGATQATLELKPGETASLEIHPPGRVLETPGWLSADLHVHSGLSDDTGLPIRERLAAFRAQGADVIVSTEHDRVVDYAPYVAENGLAGEFETVIGVEITTTTRNEATPFTAGHSNAFPVTFRPTAYRGGAPAAEGRRLRETIASQRAAGRDRIVQLNHPRPDDGNSEEPRDGSLFSHLSVAAEPLDPTRPLDALPNRALVERDPRSGLRDLDFDAMELLNGTSLAAYRANRADWFSFLLQGEVRTGTANSDSHTLGEVIALPVNYIALPDEKPFDEARFVRALRQGRAFGTTGPLLQVSLNGAGPGERAVGRQGVLRLDVRAAHWVPVDEARIYVDGRLYRQWALDGPGTANVPLAFEDDAFVTVEVQGPAEGLYADLAPGHTPLAFTNPIFVDADGDGKWTPNGLPDDLPETLKNPQGVAPQSSAQR